MKIVHAVYDENGGSHGGIPGDQTGKEILVTKWYKLSGGWKQCLVPKKRSLAEHACTFAVNIAKYNYGYSQDSGKAGRWSGYDAIRSGAVENGIGNFDCSSLVLSCYKLADPHLELPEKEGYSANVARLLMATGMFELYTEEAYLTDPELVPKGTVYCTPGRHVIICVEDGEKAFMSGKVPQDPAEVPVTEQTDAKAEKRICVKFGCSVWIHSTPDKEKTSRVPHPARGGDRFDVLGEENGMYLVARGWISANEKYVEVIPC